MTNEIPNPKSQILNLKSEIRNRRGVTLLEVLFAIMVASVGLLAAIALFPVALAMARQGRIADLTAVAASSAVGQFDTGLMRRPDHWLAWDETNNQPRFLPPNNQVISAPFNFNVASGTNILNGRPLYGRAFCIDPMGFAHNLEEDAAWGTNNSALWSWFPAVPELSPSPNAVPNASRMVRLGLHNNDPAYLNVAWIPNPSPPPNKRLFSMSYAQADRVFRIEDMLLYERPDNNALPAVQLYTPMNAGGTAVAGRRQEEGRLTWFATLVPKLDRLNGVLGEEYVLSIVVCYNRSGEATHVPGSGPDITRWPEWTAKILPANAINAGGDFHALGVGGGEVTISSMDPNVETGLNQFFYSPEAVELKQGSWVLLGRQVQTAFGAFVQVFQWYRVSDAETEARYEDVDNSGTKDRYQRDVTLVGPDWPADLDGNNVSEECDVIIVPQVIYVYERTIKLDTGAAP
jgi:type II secretory pathway pseudopilin PulG